MKKGFLYDLHNEILKKEGIYKIYGFVFILSFADDVVNIKPLIQVFRIILTIVPLVFLILIYFKFKFLRNKKENRDILNYVILFIILTFATIFNFVRDLI